MLDLYQSGAFPRKLLNNVLTNLLLKVYIILIMKRFTSSFSINQTPKINDLIISINENKKILFNTEQQSFLHREKNLSYKNRCYEIFKLSDSRVFLVGSLNQLTDNQIYLNKKELYPYLNEESLMFISRAFQLFDWINNQNYCY